jgi:hypothetical protein
MAEGVGIISPNSPLYQRTTKIYAVGSRDPKASSPLLGICPGLGRNFLYLGIPAPAAEAGRAGLFTAISSNPGIARISFSNISVNLCAQCDQRQCTAGHCPRPDYADGIQLPIPRLNKALESAFGLYPTTERCCCAAALPGYWQRQGQIRCIERRRLRRKHLLDAFIIPSLIPAGCE